MQVALSTALRIILPVLSKIVPGRQTADTQSPNEESATAGGAAITDTPATETKQAAKVPNLLTSTTPPNHKPRPE